MAHILPNLRDLLLIEAAYAMAAALLLVGELGFLGIVVGGSVGDAGASGVIQSMPSGAACSRVACATVAPASGSSWSR